MPTKTKPKKKPSGAKKPVQAAKKLKKTVLKPVAKVKPAAKVAAKAKAAPKPQVPTPALRKIATPPKPEPLPVVKITKKELVDIREKLVELLKYLQTEIRNEVKGASDRDAAHINDSLDIASDAAEGDLAFRIAESEGVEAEQIESAIEKLDEGTYGICELCNKLINLERLKFLPFATHCIKCQELSEIRSKGSEPELDDLAEGGVGGDEG